jgi:putative DNA primase/helicase
VRGDGGMVIAPPSVKPGVGAYRWLNNKEIAEPPDWLIELVTRPNKAQPADNELEDACAEMAAAKEGRRNATLNRLAFRLGKLIGRGRLDETMARKRLADAAHSSGLEENEITATIDGAKRVLQQYLHSTEQSICGGLSAAGKSRCCLVGQPTLPSARS